MIERLADKAVAAAVDRLAGAAADLPEDVVVERTDDGLILSGRGLAMRRIVDARLRWFELGR